MKVIGLCGQSGSGKGLVCSFFDDLNVKCIDTDRVYHSIISVDSQCTTELVKLFGKQVYGNPGINRQALREVAFASTENLKNLNQIAHRHILSEVRSQIDEIKRTQSYVGIIVDAPLLFESGFDQECDATIAVISSVQNKIERIMKRDNITYEVAVARISSQISDSKLSEMCTYTIENNSTPEVLKDRVHELKSIIFD